MDQKRHYIILWRKLDQPGHEASALHYSGSFWHLSGSAVFLNEGQPCLLKYHVVCNAAWETESAEVAGWIGERAVNIRLKPDAARHWYFNGAPCPEVSGCIDVDLNFSPATNLLPIRRLNLSVGEKAEVKAAWLRFPDFTLEPLVQVYHRAGTAAYGYESGTYAAELQVNPDGFVTRYPGLWQSEGYMAAVEKREREDVSAV